MVINFVQDTHTLWHSDCDRRWAPPMFEVEKLKDKVLLECTHCGERGYYPVGGSGEITTNGMFYCKN